MQQLVGSAVFSLPLATLPAYTASNASALPADGACHGPVCAHGGHWEFVVMSPIAPSAFAVIPDHSQAGNIASTTPGDAVLYPVDVRLSAANATATEGDSDIMLILPGLTSCAALVFNDSSVPQDLQTIARSAVACTSTTELQRSWPWMLADPAVQAR